MDSGIVALGILAGVALFIGAIVGAIIYIINSFFMGKVFAKLGEPQIAAWIPIYNTWKWFEIGGFPGVLSLISAVAIFGLPSALNGETDTGVETISQLAGLAVYVISAIVAYRVAPKFGKSAGLMTLLFCVFPLIYFVLLSTSDYRGIKN